jgi:hypothetical protein
MELVSVWLDFRSKSVKRFLILDTMVKIVRKDASVRMMENVIMFLGNASVPVAGKGLCVKIR